MKGKGHGDSRQAEGQSIEGHNNYQAGRDINIGAFERRIQQLPSLLCKCLPQLVHKVGESEPDSDFTTYEINEKITYNNLQAYRHWIEDYGQYGAIIDQLYDDLDSTEPGARGRILRYIRAKYDRLKAETLRKERQDTSSLDVLAIVRQKADELLGSVADEIKEELQDSAESGLKMEDIEFVSIAVVCHGFINCKVLEKPKK